MYFYSVMCHKIIYREINSLFIPTIHALQRNINIYFVFYPSFIYRSFCTSTFLTKSSINKLCESLSFAFCFKDTQALVSLLLIVFNLWIMYAILFVCDGVNLIGKQGLLILSQTVILFLLSHL
jgi:hypothetical protein